MVCAVILYLRTSALYNRSRLVSWSILGVGISLAGLAIVSAPRNYPARIALNAWSAVRSSRATLDHLAEWWLPYSRKPHNVRIYGPYSSPHAQIYYYGPCLVRSVRHLPCIEWHTTRTDSLLPHSGIAVAWESLFVFDCMIFSLTMYKTWKHRSPLRNDRLDLVAMMSRDGEG